MTVQNLIDELQKFDRNATVVFPKETVCSDANSVFSVSKKYAKRLRDGKSFILKYLTQDSEEVIVIE